uniref:DNA replication licensing factor MCM6 n=1 Tax=Glossina palpalis gambiensis TaxID=67801 RepID=A0A1B0C181_9MUSC
MLPRFYEHLKQHSHALELFCHRWLLLCFQREFSEDVVIRMYEACWSNYAIIAACADDSVLNFIKDHIGMKADKGCYASFAEVPTRHKVRDLITSKTGTLICISRRVVRTHPVHPELVLDTFMCLDCQREIRNVEQQFKFANPSTCPNPVCSNR